MITSLSLASLGVIDSAELELGHGLTVLTGETGAGKTMVVTSLQLLLGARASSDLVRTGSERAQVAAHVDVSSHPELIDRVHELGGVVEEDTITATRVVSANGRSRAALGGGAVPVTVLADVGSDLVAIHGQHDQSRLMAPGRQRELLDRFGDLTDLGKAVAQEYEQLRSLTGERDDLVNRRQERLREVDALTFGLREVSEVAPQPHEDVELLAEETRLAHAVDLKQAAEAVAAALSDDEHSVIEQLAQLQRTLDAVREHDPRLDALATRLADVAYGATDVVSELHAYDNSIEADPGRLAEVQERRASLAALQRKYGPELSDVLAWAAEAQERLTVASSTDDRLATLQGEIEQASSRWATAAGTLSSARVKSAAELSDLVTAELASLAMPDAELVVDVAESERQTADAASDPLAVTLPDGRVVSASAHGLDEVTFLLRPHRGAPLSPVQRGASGGELSRVMLAIEVALADADPVPTVVFDEVDAGVGGSAAVEVGRRLARLGRTRQVLVVTHLPQVAAFADRHWAVEKATTGEVTASDVTELDQVARVKELTRMLAGLSESTSGQAHAEELLELARAST